MTEIKIPKPAQGSVNKDRPISSLLQNQIQGLRAAEQRLPLEQQTGINVDTIKTEAEASAYVRAVTSRLHQIPKG